MPNTRITLETQLADVRIHEADGQLANGGHVVEVTLIKAGTSSNGNHYSDDLLRHSAALFEGTRAFADHSGPLDRKERSVRDLVGHYRNSRYEMSPAGGRVRADLYILPGNDWLWGLIQEAASHPDICGLSIDALGEVKQREVDGRQVRFVEAMKKIRSVDVVTRPAAGGSLDRILAGEEDVDEASDFRDPDRPDPDGSSDQGNGISDQRPVMEDGDTFTAEERKQYATIVRHHSDGTTEYKYPIPPKGHPGAEGHARSALARIDQSDLTPAEKATVTAKAHAILGTTPQESRMSESSSPVITHNGAASNAAAGVGPTPAPAAPSGAPTSTSPAAAAGPPPAGQGTQLQEGVGPAGSPPPSLSEQLRQLQAERDSTARELAQIKEALAPTPSGPADASASAVSLLEQIKHDRDVEKCGRVLDSALVAAKLPTPITDRIRKRFAGKTFSDVSLTEDINEERETLAALSSSGQITGHGYEKPLHVGLSEYEQLQAAFDKMFGVTESEATKSVPSFSGIREAFRAATGVDISTIGGVDRPLQEAYQEGLRNYVRAKVEAGTLQEAEYHLKEADVTTSTFSYLLGTSMNKRLLKDYQAWPSEWQKFCSTVAVKDFKQQDRIRLGAFGSLSTVAEDAAYTTLTLADTHATYTPTKRGNLVQISRETIINDDLYAIKQIPQKLAVAAAFTLAEFVYELLDPAAGAIYDGYILFSNTHHANSAVADASVGTANNGTALSSAAMQTGVIKMRKQQNAASKPIGLKPRFLLVPPDLEFTAMTILKSAGLPGGSNNDVNPMMGYCEPIVAPQANSFTSLGATTTFCALVADPRVIDTIEIGFIGGQVNPVLFIQDQPLYGLNFSQDVISYKVRHEYGGSVVDYRGFYLINN